MDIAGIGILAAFLAGAISFLSHCVLPLVPGYVSYFTGQPGLRTTRSVCLRVRAGALGLSNFFVLGFSTVFVLLGAGSSALGSPLLAWRTELNYLGGAIIILFGMVMLGVLRIPALSRNTRRNLDFPGGRPLGANVLWLFRGHMAVFRPAVIAECRLIHSVTRPYLYACSKLEA